jgi:hypothetical protein
MAAIAPAQSPISAPSPAVTIDLDDGTIRPSKEWIVPPRAKPGRKPSVAEPQSVRTLVGLCSLCRGVVPLVGSGTLLLAYGGKPCSDPILLF